MIVKLHEPLLVTQYRNRCHDVIALRMTEDFMYETSRGWQQGYKGQWLVEYGEGLRAAIDNESFVRQYVLEKASTG
jgi:hypothetical protein